MPPCAPERCSCSGSRRSSCPATCATICARRITRRPRAIRRRRSSSRFRCRTSYGTRSLASSISYWEASSGEPLGLRDDEHCYSGHYIERRMPGDSNLPARQPLNRAALERVLARAAELQSSTGEPSDELSDEQIVEL